MIEALAPSLLAFALASLLIEITPGPNLTYLAALTLSQGTRAGLAAVAGIALGLSVYGLAATLGLAAVISQSPILYQTLRWAGVAYFLWLAWQTWAGETETSPHRGAGRSEMGSAFRRSLITNLLNPKAAVFYVAVLPTFLVPRAAPVLVQTLLLSMVLVTVATVTHLLAVLAAGRLQRFITDPVWRTPIRRIIAIVLAAIAVWFAVSTYR